MKLGVIVALPQELGPIVRSLKPHTLKVEGLRCYVSDPYIFAAAGVGARPATAAALLVADTFKPDALISAGFCGAITGNLKPGDLILGGTTGHPASPDLLRAAKTAAPGARFDEIAMVPKVVVDAAEKKTLAEKTGAIAIDMESAAVGVAARNRGLKFLCVKVVIDTPTEPLASTYAGCWTVLWQVVRKPGTLLAMYDDSLRVKLAAEQLRVVFAELAKHLS